MHTVKPELNAQSEIRLGLDSNQDNTQAADSAPKLRLQLGTILQTSLELDGIIKLYAKQMHSLFHIDGVELEIDSSLCSGGYKVQFGQTAIRHQSYIVQTDEQQLAKLRIFSRQAIPDMYLPLIDVANDCLAYPIKNGIQYHNALQQSHKDPLTGLSNRFALHMLLEKDIARMRRHETPLSVLIIDIDNFRAINEKYGHNIGDHAIAAAAQTVLHSIREADTAFRYGGEEFLVILDESDLQGAESAAERIRRKIEHMTLPGIGKSGPTLTVSIGSASMNAADSIDSFIERAETALQRAKTEGRNRCCSEAG